MEQLIVKVTNKEKAEMLSEILTALDFVNSVELILEQTTIPEEDEDFFSLAGVWENRDISIESIRQEAWQKDIK